jgi:hypothetical protein
MKSLFLFLLIIAATGMSGAQTVGDKKVRTEKTKAGFAMSQFLYGAVERCKIATPQSSSAYQMQLERLRRDYPKLVQAVVESPDYSWYRDELDKVRKSLPQNGQAATGDCGIFTSMLKSSLDEPELRKTFEGFLEIISK